MSVRPLVPFRGLDAALAADRVLRTARPGAPASGIALDVVRHDDRVEVVFDVPGVRSEDVDLTVDKRELVLHVERRFDLPEGATMVRSERPRGPRSRRLLLAENLDTERLTADHANGVLRVSIPVLEAAKPRRVPISVADGAATEVDALTEGSDPTD